MKSRCWGPVRRFTHLSRPFPRNLAYRRVWPVEGGPFQIKGLLATLEGERTIDLVTLTDRQKGLADYGPQYLAVYRLRSRAKGETPPPSGEALQLVTEAEIPRSQIAFYLSSDIGPGGERRFVVWYTDRRGCESEAGDSIGGDKFKAVYVFRKGCLQAVGTETLGEKDLESARQPLDRK